MGCLRPAAPAPAALALLRLPRLDCIRPAGTPPLLRKENCFLTSIQEGDLFPGCKTAVSGLFPALKAVFAAKILIAGNKNPQTDGQAGGPDAVAAGPAGAGLARGWRGVGGWRWAAGLGAIVGQPRNGPA